MYKTAPRYLSGVSVFYGDDITRRNVTGEIAFFLGQSIKGPTVPVVLSSIDSAVLLYGKNSPILKALYEFWDGYIDSPKAQNIQLVALRIGGKSAALTTPFGVTITTSDAYTGIEDDYYVFIDSRVGSQVVKAWDKSKQKVLDTKAGINTGHLSVTGTFTGTLQATYGKDIDSDPYDVHYTLKTVTTPAASSTGAGYITASTAPSATYQPTTDLTTITTTVTGDKSGIDTNGGLIVVKSANTEATVDYSYLVYTSAAITGNNVSFVVSGQVTLAGAPYVNTLFISEFSLLEGDSELTNDPRAKYELFRNALAEIEQYTPDYIVPGNIYFNETDVYNKVITQTTSLVTKPLVADTFLNVDGAANWLTAGNVDLYDGTFTNEFVYSSKAVNGNNYDINLDLPTGLTITSNAASGTASFSVSGTEAELNKLRNSGFLTVAAATIKYDSCVVTGTTAALVRDLTFAGGNGALTSGATVTKALGTIVSDSFGGFIVSHSYITSTNRELGIGYVKETDIGGSYTFQWSDTQKAGYNLAHFGYLLANFCSEAAVGSNTPLCGMNVDISGPQSSNFSRASIINWIGTLPAYSNVPGTVDSVSAVLTSGTGLLGDAIMAGSAGYNRSALSDPSNGVYADPGFGLMLTAEGAVDGALARDSFGVLVDLGKFMVAGAGLLTFSNGASVAPYVDACGVYALGMLAGKPTAQGLSFSRIGQTSNTTVSVVVHRKYYNDLARMKFIVPTRERGLGWVLNNGDSVARTDSQYKLISTTRIIKAIVEAKRSLLSSFIGKALNQYYYEAAKTKIADSFRSDVANGLVNGYTFDLQIEDAAAAIGKLYLKIAINPPFELTQVTIDAVIDRAVTNTQ